MGTHVLRKRTPWKPGWYLQGNQKIREPFRTDINVRRTLFKIRGRSFQPEPASLCFTIILLTSMIHDVSNIFPGVNRSSVTFISLVSAMRNKRSFPSYYFYRSTFSPPSVRAINSDASYQVLNRDTGSAVTNYNTRQSYCLHPPWGHAQPLEARLIEVAHAARKAEFRQNGRSHSWMFPPQVHGEWMHFQGDHRQCDAMPANIPGIWGTDHTINRYIATRRLGRKEKKKGKIRRV